MAQKSVKQRLAEALLYVESILGIDDDGFLNVFYLEKIMPILLVQQQSLPFEFYLNLRKKV